MHECKQGVRKLKDYPLFSYCIQGFISLLIAVSLFIGGMVVPSTSFSENTEFLAPGPILEVYKDDIAFGDADGNGYPSAGDTLEYEVNLLNDGDADLTGVCFTDWPDSNVALIIGSVQSTSGSILSGNSPGDDFVRVCAGDIAPDDTVRITFLVIIDDPLPPGECFIYDQGEAISNEVPVELSDDPQTPMGDDPTMTYVCALPLLEAYKIDSLYDDTDLNGHPSAGDTLKYRILVVNIGNADATQSCLIDTPDVNTSLVLGSVTATDGTVLEGNDPGDIRLRVCFGTLSPGEEITITFLVVIDDPLPPSLTELADQGWVSSNELPTEPTDDPDTPEEDDPTVTPLTDEPILEAYKHDVLFIDADSNGYFSPGDLILYSVVLYNFGNEPATGVVYTDTVDANTTLVTDGIGSVFTSQGTVTSGNSPGDVIVGVSIGTIDPGEMVAITFQVTINDPVSASILVNQGYFTSNELPPEPTDDPETPDDDDPTETPLAVYPELEVYKDDMLLIDADGNGQFSPGDTLQYEVTIVNFGDVAATDVVFTDTPDAITDLVVGSVTTTQGTIASGNTPGDTQVIVNVGTILGAGGTVTITFEVTIPATVTLSIQPPVSIAKPDSHFTVCVDVGCIDETEVADQGVVSSFELPDVYSDDLDTPDPDDSTRTDITGVVISGIYFSLTFDTTIITFDSTISFMNTCLESLGWFPAWNLGVTQDTLKVWLLGGGNTTTCCECFAYIGFHVDPSATPGDTSEIHFEECEINEGDPMCITEDGIFIVNRPPVFASLPDTIYFIEAHEQCFTVSATDPDGDFMVMWAVIDSCADSTGAVFGVTDTVTGIGEVEADFCWCPIKEDSCDTVDVTFFVKSTMPDSLMDTLNVTIVVENTFIHGQFPDTSYYPCGWIEMFFCIDPNYVDCIDTLGIFSLDVILSYDPECIHVTEVGHVGTLTEFWGTITYNIINGTILVSLSGNDTLDWCDTTLAQQECVDLFYVGFTVDPEAVPGDTCWLCIEHVKVNEGWPPAYWGDCSEIGCAAIAIDCNAISGTVTYCSTGVAVPGVEMKMSGDAIDTVLTDSSGDYEFPCVFACGDYCIKPQKEWLPPQVVNSFDASMIMRSLCNQITLDSCARIAADVTGDGNITGYDAAILLRWRVGYEVPGRTGEWKFNPDSICYHWLTEDMLDQDYGAIVMGDVSLNWPGDGPPKMVAGTDSAALICAGVAAPPGRTFVMPISVKGTPPIYSADITVTYDPQIVTALEAATVDVTENFLSAFQVAEGEMRIAMAGAEPVLSGGPIAYIVGQVSEAVKEGATSDFELTVTLNENITIAHSERFTAKLPVPQVYDLAQNYPNPFNPETVIQYQLPKAGRITLKVYNILGQEIVSLVDELKEVGYYTVRWNGRDRFGAEAASGVYYYRLVAGDFVSTKRMLLLK
ncbi:MAG: T9SS type A sorting domain-containing protein [Gemmatimonadota bacterium]|nr:MAG: T9SS type A sorting domain-containing protein [Gemmatimonadota bacterium]